MLPATSISNSSTSDIQSTMYLSTTASGSGSIHEILAVSPQLEVGNMAVTLGAPGQDLRKASIEKGGSRFRGYSQLSTKVSFIFQLLVLPCMFLCKHII